jgi:hypothetical protein
MKGEATHSLSRLVSAFLMLRLNQRGANWRLHVGQSASHWLGSAFVRK